MALNDPLIALSDIREYRDVDVNYDPVRFTGFLNEVQNVDLRELLGDALWLDFFENLTDANYLLLLNGENYIYNGDTVHYPGLKPYLVWTWLNILPLEGNVHHTQSGDVSYLRDVTSPPSKAALNQAKENYKKNMLVEQNKIVQYLNTKSSEYPLWVGKRQTDQTGLNFSFV